MESDLFVNIESTIDLKIEALRARLKRHTPALLVSGDTGAQGAQGTTGPTGPDPTVALM